MPSRDVLARVLGVSEFVVRAACSELAADGLICGKPRRGYAVLKDDVRVERRVVLDVHTESYGSYSSSVSRIECERYFRRKGYEVQSLSLGHDSPRTPYIIPLRQALKASPDMVILRTNISRRSLVTRMVADSGLPYVTLTLGRKRHHSPGRCIGDIRLRPEDAVRQLVADCRRAGVKSVLQVGFGQDSFIDLGPFLADAGMHLEDLQIGNFASDDLDAIVKRTATATERRIDRGRLPDLIFAVDDYLSLGVLRALSAKGLAVPGDVRFVAYSNLGSGLFPFDDFARIELDPREDGREIAKYVISWLETGRTCSYANVHRYRRGRSFPV